MLKELELSADGLRTFATDSPPELLAFLATFALAALFGLLTLIGAPSRLLAFLAGGGALGFLGYGLLQMKDQAAAAGILAATVPSCASCNMPWAMCRWWVSLPAVRLRMPASMATPAC